jgi:hypothetical protein
VGQLDRHRERLHALPGVVGTGVGLRAGEPVIEVYVAGRDDGEHERAIREILDLPFVVVAGSEPARAQVGGDAAQTDAPRRDREE